MVLFDWRFLLVSVLYSWFRNQRSFGCCVSFILSQHRGDKCLNAIISAISGLRLSHPIFQSCCSLRYRLKISSSGIPKQVTADWRSSTVKELQKINKNQLKTKPRPQMSSRDSSTPLLTTSDNVSHNDINFCKISRISDQSFICYQYWPEPAFRQLLPTAYKCLWLILVLASAHVFELCHNEWPHKRVPPVFLLEFSYQTFRRQAAENLMTLWNSKNG